MKRASVAIGLFAILIAGGSVAWIAHSTGSSATEATRGRRPEPPERPAYPNRSESGNGEPGQAAGTRVFVRQGNKPLPGARVQLLGAAPERGSFIETERAFVPLAERVADRNGDVLLPCDGSGPWVARATAPGLLAGSTWITNPDGGYVIRLEPGGAYGLQVVDDTDSPVAGAEILVYPLRCQGPPRMTYTTDATGRANMRLGKEEDMVVRKTREELLGVAPKVPHRPVDPHQVIELEPHRMLDRNQPPTTPHLLPAKGVMANEEIGIATFPGPLPQSRLDQAQHPLDLVHQAAEPGHRPTCWRCSKPGKRRSSSSKNDSTKR